jgi:hypothetical protein
MPQTQPHPETRKPDHPEPDRVEPWKNTRPRSNPERDERDVERSAERLEMLLGH